MRTRRGGRALILCVALTAAAGIPRLGHAVVTELTLAGPTVYRTGQLTSGFTGRLTAGSGIGLPNQSVDVLVDGVTNKRVTTTYNGSFAFSVGAFTGSPVPHTIAVAAYAGTPLEARSETLTLLPSVRLTITPTLVDVGEAMLGTGERPEALVTITNDGAEESGPLSLSMPSVDFAMVGCGGQRLPAGGSCALTVAFTPRSVGVKTATLSAAASPGATASATLRGRATGLSAIGVAFGTHTTGTVSEARLVVVTNTSSTHSTGPVSTSFGGPQLSEFILDEDGCSGAVLAPGGTCSQQWRFAPTAAGAKMANTVIESAPGGRTEAYLTGTGEDAVLTIAPSEYSFGRVLSGTTRTKDFVVTNTGAIATGALSRTVSNTRFQIVADACSGVSLGSGQTCTLRVSFTSYYDPYHPSTWVQSGTLSVYGSPGGKAVARLGAEQCDPVYLAPC